MRQKRYLAGSRVREFRLKAAIATQRELAQRTGIAPTIISDLERGRRSVSPAYANRIAEALGVKTSVLWDNARREKQEPAGTAPVYRQKREKRKREKRE